MKVPRGANLRSAITAARLLEDDALEFYNVLDPSEGNLELYYDTRGGYVEAVGQLEIWWTVVIEARRWGIKDISPFAKKLVLDGWYKEADEEGDMVDTGETFHYEYPEKKETAKIGLDPDAPTPGNVFRLAAPKWTVEFGVNQTRNERTMFVPEATVHLDKRTIRIEF